jgi:SAM-dependent methyltransferase
VQRPAEEYDPSHYWERLLGAQFDESGVAYPELARSFNRAIHRAQIAAVASALDEHGVHPESVLDVGSGTGVWIDFWRQRGATSITGLDLTETAARNLRARFPSATFLQADIGGPVALEAASFDAISAMSVLLHITDEAAFRRALANIAALLRPRGWLVLIEPAVVHRWWGPAFGVGSNSRARTVTEWRTALRENGLALVDLRPATVLLANPADTRRRVTWGMLSLYWRAVRRLIGRREWLGRLAGQALLSVDRGLVRTVRPGPSTKCLLVRKSAAA